MGIFFTKFSLFFTACFVALSSAFFVPKTAHAALNLPQTSCDSVYEDLIVNGFSVHLTNHSSKEDGTKAFSYSPGNNFVTVKGSKFIFNFDLLFQPGSQAGAKLLALNANCGPVFGFGPFFTFTPGSLNHAITFDSAVNTVEMNGEQFQVMFPSGIARFVWVEVMKGNLATDVASYSYLVDLLNPANPTGTVGEDQEPSGKRPVLIIPGITGTELYDGNDLIWPNLGKMFTDVGDQFITDSLSLDSNGNSIKNIKIGEVIKKLSLISVFDKLEEDLLADNYEDNISYFFFPYDWRLDNNINTLKLKEKIQGIKNQTGFKKVDVVTHSMGGLILKNYLYEFGKDSVNKVIFVGMPHLGAPKAGKVLIEGDDYSIPWLEMNRMKELAQNSPSVYQLLPTQKYFDTFTPYLESNNSYSGLDYAATKNIFLDLGKNVTLFNNTEDFFNKNLQDLDYLGLQVFNIAGCRTGTTALYKMSQDNNFALPVGYTSGDGTVPLPSSSYINIGASNKFYVKKGNHAGLPSQENVRNLILDILKGNGLSPSGSVSNSSDFCKFKGKKLSFHSPVAVYVYDKFGNHAGPIENNGLENNIPGADYQIINGEKFIFLPTDENEMYEVKGMGEQTGSFDLHITEIDNGDNIKTTVFNDVPVTTESTVDLSVSESSLDNSILLNSKDVNPDAILQGLSQLDLTAPETTIALNGTKGWNGWYKRDVQVALEATDDSSGILTTKYSLDGGLTYNEYANPIDTFGEGTSSIKYYSVDNAGNNEEVKTKEIKIDDSIPEFVIVFDINIKDFKITSNELNAKVDCGKNKCTATDEAGNINEIKFTKIINKNTFILRLEDKANTSLIVEYNNLTKTFKHIFNSKDLNVILDYNQARNTTKVNWQEKGKKARMKTLPGIKFLQIKTKQGSINLEIK